MNRRFFSEPRFTPVSRNVPSWAIWLHRTRTSILLFAFLCITGIGLVATNFVVSVDDRQTALRFALSEQKSFDHTAVIALDSKSLSANRDWPWPREVYGELVSNLDQAGVRQIAFDFDFSAPRPGDIAFAEAIHASSTPVYLTAFTRGSTALSDGSDQNGGQAEVSPADSLATVAEVAAAMFPVDRDGLVRQTISHDVFEAGAVNTLPFALAGEVDEFDARIVDFAYKPESLTVISMIDALRSPETLAGLKGKTVIIGATANELGDYVTVPHLGRQSGVFLNAVSHEMLVRSGGLQLAPIGWTVALIIIAAAVSSLSVQALGIRRFGLFNLIFFVATLTLSFQLQHAGNVILHTTAAHMVQFLGAAIMGVLAMDRYAARAFQSNMELRTHAELLSAMMSSEYEGFLTVTCDGVINSCNDRAKNLLGVEEDVLNKTLDDISPNMAELLAKIDGNACLPLSWQQPDGRHIHVDACCSRVVLSTEKSSYERRKDSRTLTLVSLHDLTEQKMIEATERKAKEEYARALAAKTAMIDTMTHELRTPLNGVIGFADLIAKEAFGAHEVPEYREFGEMIQVGGRELLMIVEDMLLAGRFEAGTVESDIRPVKLDDIFDAALAQASQRPTWQNPTIQKNLLPDSVCADPKLLQTVCYHLLENANKFGGSDATLTVESTIVDGQLRVSFADDGPGTDATPEHMCALFEQADNSRSRAFEGCGLGLYLVDQACRLMEGKLAITSMPGQGFTATISLPMAMAVTDPQSVKRAAS